MQHGIKSRLARSPDRPTAFSHNICHAYVKIIRRGHEARLTSALPGGSAARAY